MDATTGNGSSELVLMVGTVNINITVVSVDVAAGVYARFEAAKVENARHDQISSVFRFVQFAVVFPNINATLEHRSRRCARANSVADLV